MKGILMTILGVALAVVIFIAVIIPIASKAKLTGQGASTNQTTIDTRLGTMVTPIN